MSAIELRDTWFSYAADPVVRGVTLLIERGETVALLGHNGAGKTTLTKLIMGLLHPTRGEILVAGVPNMDQAPEEIARDAAYVFQHSDQQLFSRTVIDEVSFAPRQFGRSPGDARDIAFHALLDLGIEVHAGEHPYDLAPAQRKLVAIAAALAQQARVLILDEPTQGLDRASRERIAEIVRASAAKGVTVLAASHDLSFVAEALDRAVVMKEGTIVLDRPVRELFHDERRAAELGLEVPPAARLAHALALDGMPVRSGDVAAALALKMGARGNARPG